MRSVNFLNVITTIYCLTWQGRVIYDDVYYFDNIYRLKKICVVFNCCGIFSNAFNFFYPTVIYLFFLGTAYGGYVKLTHDGPTVQGGIITFQADLYYSDGTRPSGTFVYIWRDDAVPSHRYEVS